MGTNPCYNSVEIPLTHQMSVQQEQSDLVYGVNTCTTPGAYTITVTGTSASVSATVGTVALTVQ